MDISPPELSVTPWTRSAVPSNPSTGAPDGDGMRAAAKQFETVFLAEMLKHTGVGKQRGEFHGGAGEAGFSGFLTLAYAEEIADRGTVGLADQVYAAMKARSES